jgi:glycosyltransferase involved in cell wall biosynthesis
VSVLQIGVDARELLGARTGVGRYLGELMTRWTVRPDAARRRFILYSPKPLVLAWPHTDIRLAPGGRGTWWEQTTLSAAIRRDDPDVFFAPAYTAPLSLGTPLALTIHDISFSRHPRWFRFRERKRRQILTRVGARRAGVVLTVSEFSRAEIQELYGVPPERIEVIPNGLVPRVGGAARREPLVLYTGSIFNRRRVPDLIAAFAIVAREVPQARLVIAGENRTWPFEDLSALAARHGVAGRVVVRDYVADEELASLYARASAFAFLSEYEGFGLTPLEALAAGIPPVVLDRPVLREVLGDAARFVATPDAHAVAAGLSAVLFDPVERQRLLSAAGPVLGRYDWRRTAEVTLQALEEAGRP